MLWYGSTLDNPHLDTLCRHLDHAPDQRLVELWNSQVKGPCEEAADHCYVTLQQSNRLGELFCYRAPAALGD